RNQTLQTDTGLATAFPGTSVSHQVDTCGANSGSPVIDTTTGLGIAIHTHCGCANPTAGTFNSGTQITQAALQASIAAVCVGPGPCGNDECVTAIPVVNGTNGIYGNTTATPSLPAFSCGFNVT